MPACADTPAMMSPSAKPHHTALPEWSRVRPVAPAIASATMARPARSACSPEFSRPKPEMQAMMRRGKRSCNACGWKPRRSSAAARMLVTNTSAPCKQLLEHGGAFEILQVQHDAVLVAVQRGVVCCDFAAFTLAARLAVPRELAAGRLHLDDLRAFVGEHLAAVRARR
jgi:hypothetical protein